MHDMICSDETECLIRCDFIWLDLKSRPELQLFEAYVIGVCLGGPHLSHSIVSAWTIGY